MSNVEIENAIPSDFVIEKPTSTSRAILRKSLQEILPSEQVQFSPTGNSIIRFQISSNSDILSGPESYFRFVVQQQTAGQDGDAVLEVGGVHSLIKNAEIRFLGSGISVQRSDAYNKYNALKSLLLDDPVVVDSAGWTYGDAMSDALVENEANGGYIGLTGTNAVITTAGAFSITGGLLLSEVQIGDEIMVNGATGNDQAYVGRVIAIASATAMTVSPAPVTALSSTGGLAFVKRTKGALTSRARASVGKEVVLCMKLRMSLLQQHLPLFLLSGGIEISLELEYGYRAFQTRASIGISAANTAVGADYYIKLPRFFAMMLTPHPDIVDEYIRQWQSPEGLVYSIPSVRYRRQTSTSQTDDSLSINPGVRSARRAYMVIQSSGLAEGASTSYGANLYGSVSSFQRDKVTEFQVQVGSSLYPNRPVKMYASDVPTFTAATGVWASSSGTADDYTTSGEAFEMREQLKNICGNYGSSRIKYEDWRDMKCDSIIF